MFPSHDHGGSVVDEADRVERGGYRDSYELHRANCTYN